MTQEIKPMLPVNLKGLEKVAESLFGEEPKKETGDNSAVNKDSEGFDLEKCIILPGRKHGSYEYPDLLVLPNTVGMGNWHKSNQDLHDKGLFMLTLRQYTDLFNMLKSETVYDGKGQKIGKDVVKFLSNSLFYDFRNEQWTDTRFSRKLNQTYINYNRIKSDGSLEKVTEPLEPCLMKDTLGIDLPSCNSQGMPVKKAFFGRHIGYKPPEINEDSVAVFGYYCDGSMILYCSPYFKSDQGNILKSKIKK